MKTIRLLVTIVCVFVSPVTMHRWNSCDAAPPSATPSSAGQTVSSKPTIPAKTAPVAAKPGPASDRSISYGWKPGRSYTYRVKANTQRTDSEEDLEGTVVYTVKSIDPDGLASVICAESFSHSRKDVVASALASTAHDGHASFCQNHFSSTKTTTVDSAPEQIEIDRHGRIVGAERVGNLPFPVGRISRLAIEPLSSGDENAWTTSGDVGIVLTERADMFSSPPANSREEPLLAREKTVYAMKASAGVRVPIRKTYRLATIAEVDGEPFLAVTGEGELTFDRQNGVFMSSTMEIHVTLRENGNPSELASLFNCVLVRVAEESNKDH